MVVRLGPGAADPLFGSPVAGSDVRLHPYDGLDASFLRFFLEFPRGVHVPVVRDSQSGLLKFECPGNQVVDTVRAIQERVLGMAMQVNKGHALRIRAG